MPKALTAAGLALFLSLSGCANTPTYKDTIVKSWKGDDSPFRVAFLKELATRPKVALAVVGTAETTSSMVTGFEQACLHKYGRWRNFTLVDRAALNKVMDESPLTAKPDIPDESRLKIGKLTGATHLVSIHLMTVPIRGGSPGEVDNDFEDRLIDVGSGRVLAAQSYVVHRILKRPKAPSLP
jgi:hypothetical protein